MKVLVTGGTGVVGKSAVEELVRRGHSVRLLSRSAKEDVAQRPADIILIDSAGVSDSRGAVWRACSTVCRIVSFSQSRGSG